MLIVGAGASGLMCAIEAGKRGRTVVVLDHARKLAEKIRISGGGRCNFTNMQIKPDNFISGNPHFCRSALARYTPQHFTAMLDKHGIAYSEKALGQLFCDNGAEAIIAMLKQECADAGVRLMQPCEISHLAKDDSEFEVHGSCGVFRAQSLVIATGGLSIPQIGASPFGYKVAEQFGIPVTKLHAGLVPLNFHPEAWQRFAGLAGISLPVQVSCGKQAFRESLLFTHRGMSGPAILQISSYWEHGQALHIDLLPDLDMRQILREAHQRRTMLDNFLGQYLPKRLAEIWCAEFAENKPLNQFSEKALQALAGQLHDWQVTPTGTQGYGKAEVTCGGVDTHALSSKTMEANNVPGLYFIGEVLDMTGHLGGYNLHWAWASGHAAGQAV